MSYIFEMKVGKYTYLYEAESYRNQDGKPRSKKHIVGKVDPLTGEYKYKPEYLEKMARAGLPVKMVGPKIKTEPKFTVEDIRKSSVREYGAYYFLNTIAEQIGLKEVLSVAVPEHWRELLTLAIYMICTEDPLLYCRHWLESTETLPVGPLSSQRVSELLHSLTEEQRTEFYRGWAQYRREREYLALDITSISSWSTLIDDVEWGYNRDHENLPQINLSLLMGQSSRLPVFQTVYSGSLKDVSTLKSTLQKATCYLKGDEPILLVMDKGFYSKKNVDAMLNDEANYQFIIPVSFTSRFAKNQIAGERKDIDRVSNTIVSGNNSVRGVTKLRSWGAGKKLYTHIFYNALKAGKQKEDLYAHVSSLVKLAESNAHNSDYQHGFKKYLLIRASAKAASGYTVNIREDVVEKELETAGWLVLISNHVTNCIQALTIYRAKDVIEKGFLRFKNSIDLGRLRVHSQDSMQNKLLLGFISLILLSHIDKVMLEKELYKKMTMKKLLLILKKLRIQYVNGYRILFPLTKEQKLILDAFSIAEPV
jgi:hypothetical protein